MQQVLSKPKSEKWNVLGTYLWPLSPAIGHTDYSQYNVYTVFITYSSKDHSDGLTNMQI